MAKVQSYAELTRHERTEATKRFIKLADKYLKTCKNKKDKSAVKKAKKELETGKRSLEVWLTVEAFLDKGWPTQSQNKKEE
ncbi:MAG: hypothetical protein Q8O88_06330 [bacterium]|nr:hypothetical protein [bacterium]